MKEEKFMTFQNPQFGELTVLVGDREIYFPAIDCAKMMGYRWARRAVAVNCYNAVKLSVPNPKNMNKTVKLLFIPEYDLRIMARACSEPKAYWFERWIMRDVIPAICEERLQ